MKDRDRGRNNEAAVCTRTVRICEWVGMDVDNMGSMGSKQMKDHCGWCALHQVKRSTVFTASISRLTGLETA